MPVSEYYFEIMYIIIIIILAIAFAVLYYHIDKMNKDK